VRLTHEFVVPVGVSAAWDVLLDGERVAACLPGAALDRFDPDGFAGSVRVKVGPISMQYRGEGRFLETDEERRTITIQASGRDVRSADTTASATISARLVEDSPAATRVFVDTDLTLTGKPAQFGRGIIADVSNRILAQFVERLRAEIGRGQVPEAAISASQQSAGRAGDSAHPERVARASTSDQQESALEVVPLIAGMLRSRLPALGATLAVAVLAYLFGKKRRSHDR